MTLFQKTQNNGQGGNTNYTCNIIYTYILTTLPLGKYFEVTAEHSLNLGAWGSAVRGKYSAINNSIILRHVSETVQALDPDLCMGCLNPAGDMG